MRSWQYDGTAPWADVIDWCKDRLPTTDSWGTNGHDTIVFFDDLSYLVFVMKWVWR